MTKKRRTGLMIGLAVACIAVLCAAGACNGTSKEEKAMHRVIVTTTTEASQPTEITTTVLLTTTAPVTTTVETTAVTTTTTQSTTAVTCSATEHGLDETPTYTTAEQTSTAETTIQPTTTTPVTTTAPAPAKPCHGQTSGDYIYVNGFGWIFNEGGGGEGSLNYEMYCNGNKIGYFG